MHFYTCLLHAYPHQRQEKGSITSTLLSVTQNHKRKGITSVLGSCFDLSIVFTLNAGSSDFSNSTVAIPVYPGNYRGLCAAYMPFLCLLVNIVTWTSQELRPTGRQEVKSDHRRKTEKKKMGEKKDSVLGENKHWQTTASVLQSRGVFVDSFSCFVHVVDLFRQLF